MSCNNIEADADAASTLVNMWRGRLTVGTVSRGQEIGINYRENLTVHTRGPLSFCANANMANFLTELRVVSTETSERWNESD